MTKILERRIYYIVDCWDDNYKFWNYWGKYKTMETARTYARNIEGYEKIRIRKRILTDIFLESLRGREQT